MVKTDSISSGQQSFVNRFKAVMLNYVAIVLSVKNSNSYHDVNASIKLYKYLVEHSCHNQTIRVQIHDLGMGQIRPF